MKDYCTAIIIIIIGLGKILIPKYARIYKWWEMFGKAEEPSKFEMIIDLCFGTVFIAVGTWMLISLAFER